jgi:hypothetical protein
MLATLQLFQPEGLQQGFPQKSMAHQPKVPPSHHEKLTHAGAK